MIKVVLCGILGDKALVTRIGTTEDFENANHLVVPTDNVFLLHGLLILTRRQWEAAVSLTENLLVYIVALIALFASLTLSERKQFGKNATYGPVIDRVVVLCLL